MATAKNKIIRQLKNNLTFENAERVLNDRGYSVVFFNTPAGDIEIERYKLFEERDTLMAFTYSETARIVFIDGTLSAEDKLYSALHELGHIVLGHLEHDVFNRNKVLMDIEADNFAYNIIYGKKKGTLCMLVSAIVLALSLIFSISFDTNSDIESIANQPIQIEETAGISDAPTYTETNVVYVTPTGTKFHLNDCMYVKNKTTLTELPRSEASAKYAPCKICKP